MFKSQQLQNVLLVFVNDSFLIVPTQSSHVDPVRWGVAAAVCPPQVVADRAVLISRG